MPQSQHQLVDEETSLVKAIHAHRAVVEGSPDDSVAVMAAINELHHAIVQYADKVMEISGWGNPFVGPYDPDEESADDRDDDISVDEAHDD